MSNQKVAIYREDGLGYPEEKPFHPSNDYPEYPYRGRDLTCCNNQVYTAVRETFRLLGLDEARAGKSDWNPLGAFIRPGDCVLVKPNLVRHYNPLGYSLDSLVTSASVVRAVLDYVVLALRGEGKIIVGDAPLQNCDFNHIITETGLADVVEFSRRQANLDIALLDFRREWAIKDQHGLIKRRMSLDKSRQKHVAVDLGENSHLAEISHRTKDFRVTNYMPDEMIQHHNKTTHEYLVARPVLKADCFINLPKLKTHRKAGLTAALKNTVGINGSKDWLPHHVNGALEEGGDQYLRLCFRKRLISILLDHLESETSYRMRAIYGFLRRIIWKSRNIWPFPDPYFEGSWYGNDTLWRTILDLNWIVFFADVQGQVYLGKPKRRYFALVDGIVAGEREGPVEPTPRSCGVLIAGDNPLSVDTCCAMTMGFDPSCIPVIRHGWHDAYLGYDPDWRLVSNDWSNKIELKDANFSFIPPSGWDGHIQAG
jgi:uncharacterized protein (DUF362 family)